MTVILSDAGRAHLAALLAGDARAGQIIDELPGDDIEAIASHPDVTWKLLCEQPDRDAALRLMEHRFHLAFQRGDDDQVRAELAGPELVRDALSECAVEELALRAVTVLAWSDPQGAERIYARLCSQDSRMSEVYMTCQAVLVMAPLWRMLEAERSVPRPLGAFVRLQWMASSARLVQLITDLHRDMRARTDLYLDTLDALAARYSLLLLHIVELTERFMPQGLPTLSELDESERRQLGAALGAIDGPMRRGPRFVHVVAGALGAGTVIGLSGLGGAALMIALGVVAGAAGYTVWSRRGAYGRLIRRPLAAYLAESGTPTACVVSWLLANRKAVKRIDAFEVAIDADAALAAIARLGRMARHHGDLATGS